MPVAASAQGVAQSFLVSAKAAVGCIFTREQHRHGAAVADGRFRVDDLSLSRADHDDAASLQSAMVRRLPQRFRMHGRGGIERVGDVGGDGHLRFPRSPFLFFSFVIPERAHLASEPGIHTPVTSFVRNIGSGVMDPGLARFTRNPE